MKPCYGCGQNFVCDIYSTQREPSFFVKWHPLKTLIKNFACGALYINIPFYVFAYHIVILTICVLRSGLPLRKFGLLSSFPLFYKIIYHSFLYGFFAWPFLRFFILFIFYQIFVDVFIKFLICIYFHLNIFHIALWPLYPYFYCSWCIWMKKKEPEENTNWCTRFERKLGD